MRFFEGTGKGSFLGMVGKSLPPHIRSTEVQFRAREVEHMRKELFEEIVEEALMSLPEEFSRKLENVEVLVEKEPSEEILRKLGLPRGALLGLYHGVPLKRKSVWAAANFPDRISIYRDPILAISRDRKNIQQRIREVVMHEIGHHFGLTDKEMEGRERRSPTRGKCPDDSRRGEKET
jgi:predicted Zn-dependent protease with MMP-like domain